VTRRVGRYAVVTHDGTKLGEVVGEKGIYFLVQYGRLSKRVRPLPRAKATVRQEQTEILSHISRNEFSKAPEVRETAHFDAAEADEYYGRLRD
jgi:hypothetical protein